MQVVPSCLKNKCLKLGSAQPTIAFGSGFRPRRVFDGAVKSRDNGCNEREYWTRRNRLLFTFIFIFIFLIDTGD